MRVLFESQDLWGVIEAGVPVIQANQVGVTQEQKETRKRDKKALFLIFQAVEESVFERISTANSSKEAWEILQHCYRGEDRVKKIRLQTLRCEFDNLKMKESETVEDFYNRVVVLVNQMRVNGEVIEDRRIVEKILRSLTRKFEYIVVAIEETKDLSTFTLESLLGKLQSHEMRLKQFDSTAVDQAFQYKLTFKHDNKDKGKNVMKYKNNPKEKWKGQSSSSKQSFTEAYRDKNRELTPKGRGKTQLVSNTTMLLLSKIWSFDTILQKETIR